MTAARSRRAGRGRKVTQEIKRGTTRTGAAKARALSEGRSKLELKAPQTGTSRKAMRDSPKPEQEIKRGTTRTRQPRVEREVVPGTTRVRKTGDGSKKGVGGTAPGIMLRDSGVKPKPKTKPKPSSGKTSSSAASKPTTSAKPSAASKTEKKKDKEKKTLFGLEIKPSSRFAGRGGKRRRVAGRAMGGMMKSKMASKGGAKGGKRMPTGMKKGGMPMKTVNGMRVPAFAADGKGPNDLTKKMMVGGMMKSKGMAKGGTNKKRAVSRKPRGVGAALRGFGKALKK